MSVCVCVCVGVGVGVGVGVSSTMALRCRSASFSARKVHVCTLRKVRQGGSYDSLSLRKDARPYAFT